MSKEKFYIDQEVRVTDINYGQHLGMTQLHGMAHNARCACLRAIGLTELDVGGVGVIVSESNIKFSKECFMGDMLRFIVDFEIISKVQFKCIISVFDMKSNENVAKIEDKMICYDYSRRRPSAIPEGFKSIMSAGQNASN